MAYFLDTYVLVEMARGNSSAEPYLRAPSGTSILNLVELRCAGRVKGFFPEARRVSDMMEGRALREIPPGVAFEAADLRGAARDSRGRTFSYIDVLGYCLARHHSMTFVSSPEFSHLPGVEVV